MYVYVYMVYSYRNQLILEIESVNRDGWCHGGPGVDDVTRGGDSKLGGGYSGFQFLSLGWFLIKRNPIYIILNYASCWA